VENWYVIYAKPKSERQAAAALAAKGIASYLPLMPAGAVRRGRSTVHPYFPCYLFAHLDMEQVGISRLNWTPGVRHVVCFGSVPARVDEHVIDRIRQHLAQPHAMDDQGEFLEQGDHVVITTGPLADLEAVFDKRLSATGRARVLVQFLRRWTPIDVEAIALRKVS
jgi:transcription elongation factor/antiterminator RfaH